jgi:hypothetical protein
MRDGIPRSLKPLFEKVTTGKGTYRECIKAFCYECITYESKLIRECDVENCPLWHKRPFKGK